MMTFEEREARYAVIRTMPAEEALKAYQAIWADDRAEMARAVLMCSCDDYMTCAHPWPQIGSEFLRVPNVHP